MNKFVKLLAVALLGFASCNAMTAEAASLAGQEGDVKRRIMFTNDMIGGCANLWRKYVAASGHSAYAATPVSPTAEGFICASTVNAGSKAAAEKKAIAQCNAGLKRWKINFVRLCGIMASK